MSVTAPTLDHVTEADALARLQGDPNYRVLKRFRPRDAYAFQGWNLGDPAPLKVGLYVDTETTGLDRERDEITELGMVAFSYEPQHGVIHEILTRVSYFEEPTIPIPAEVQELTGITPEMVKGHRIDDSAVSRLVGNASIVIAHNAESDRQMLERRLSVFKSIAWACSQREVEWSKFGVLGGALGNILIGACGEFTDDRHRALDDCLVGVHVLATGIAEERTAFAHLLESARQPSIRIYALNAPFAVEDRLKARHYRWSDGTGAGPKAWYRDVKPSEQIEEVVWLRDKAHVAKPQVVTFTATDRWSARAA